jgi:hypothetical protein
MRMTMQKQKSEKKRAETLCATIGSLDVLRGMSEIATQTNYIAYLTGNKSIEKRSEAWVLAIGKRMLEIAPLHTRR